MPITVYEEMSELLFSNFGIMPSEDLRELHRKAARTVNDRAVSMSTVQEQLREPDGPPGGVLICEYDFFKILYHAEARSILRSGNAVHIGLLSVTNESGGELPKRSLDRVMEHLLDLIRSCLRKGRHRFPVQCVPVYLNASPRPIMKTAAWSANGSSNLSLPAPRWRKNPSVKAQTDTRMTAAMIRFRTPPMMAAGMVD